MKTYPLKDEEGRVFAFEISNSLVSRLGVCDVVRGIPGVRVIREPRRWRLSTDDQFCEFELEGVRFVVWEPYGDSSRYWIGPEPPRWIAAIDRVRDAFDGARPFALALRSFLGHRRTD